jgi:hypothetical protein
MSQTRVILRAPGPSLNTVSTGLKLAETALCAIRNGHRVEIDFAEVSRITPSCANALVMTMLGGMSGEAFASSISICNAAVIVAESWNEAVQRYHRGIRLSSQSDKSA